MIKKSILKPINHAGIKFLIFLPQIVRNKYKRLTNGIKMIPKP